MQTTSIDNIQITYIDALLAGVKWGSQVGDGTTLTVSLPYFEMDSAWWERNYSDKNEPWTLNTASLNLEHIGLAAKALQEWSNVADLEFAYVAEDSSGNKGEIRVTLTEDYSRSDTWGWGYYPSSAAAGGDVWVNAPAVDDDWSLGSSNLGSFIHEFGHALGLKHPFEEGITLSGDWSEFESTQYSVMSYTDHPSAQYRTVTETSTGYSWEMAAIQPSTPMLFDIAAIQYLYGPNMNHAVGDNVYTFDPTEPFFTTIWDAGGNDTISVENFSDTCILDLRDGRYSSIAVKSDSLPAWADQEDPPDLYDGTDNLAIAFNVVIENAVGSSSPDMLLGNDADNILTGNGGDDLIDGFAGIDTLVRTERASQVEVLKLDEINNFEFEIRGGFHGNDRMENVERIEFSDSGLALDLDGTAGQTARVLGVTFGAQSVNNPEYVKIGLDLLDGGMTYTDLAALAVEAAGASIHAQVVDLLWFNIVGSHPGAQEMQPFIDMLEGGKSVGELGVMAADMQENADNINLLGLADTGLPYALV